MKYQKIIHALVLVGFNIIMANKGDQIEQQFDQVASEDVPMAILCNSLKSAKTEEEKEEINQNINKLKAERKSIDHLIRSIAERSITGSNVDIADVMDKPMALTKHDSYMRAVDYLQEKCATVMRNPYAMGKMQVIVNLCELGVPSEKIIQAIADSCHIVAQDY